LLLGAQCAHAAGRAPHLRAGMAASGAQWGCDLLDPRTGEILRCTRNRTSIPRTGNPPAELLKTACVTGPIRARQHFKIVTFAAALDAGAISPSDTVFCNNGLRILGSAKIRDHHAYGYLPAAGVLSHSSNIGTGRIASCRLGGFNRHGQDWFGQASGSIWGEAAGMLPTRLTITGRALPDHSGVRPGSGVTGCNSPWPSRPSANDGVLMRPCS